MICLNQNERGIMATLWYRPGLTWAEINDVAKQLGAQTWSDRSSLEMLRKLEAKGLIKATGRRLMNRKQARIWEPTVPKDEYYADMLAVEMTPDERARLIHRLAMLPDAEGAKA